VGADPFGVLRRLSYLTRLEERFRGLLLHLSHFLCLTTSLMASLRNRRS
jgi:hypothetical protein